MNGIVYLIAGVILLIAFIGLYLLIRKSPEGFQDENGFHYGKPHKKS